MPFLKEILDIQKEYPHAGKFRVRGLLEKQYQEQARDEPPSSERTVSRAMALNRQFHDALGPWQSQKDEVEPDTTPKYLLYRPQYRHQFWFIDMRYLVQMDGHWVYSLCLIEGSSRTILAGMAAEHQDLTAVVQILFAMLSAYGCLEVIVSDNAKVFNAHHYLAILKELEIEPHSRSSCGWLTSSLNKPTPLNRSSKATLSSWIPSILPLTTLIENEKMVAGPLPNVFTFLWPGPDVETMG